jgi:CPA2 family monovalent cation:H+ antiporter-2
MVQTLSELGVIFLMFSLGLEFSLSQLARVGRTSGIVGVVQSFFLLWLGYTAGRLLGWSPIDSLFAGAAIAISSTTIIVKVLKENEIRGPFTQIVFGILIIEDLVAVVLLTILTAVASGSEWSPAEVGVTIGKLGAFLAALLLVGMFVVPRFMRFVIRLERPETTLVASVGLCFGAAWLAQSFGYSVALGAFLAGALVAESGQGKLVERLIEPVRDVFAAIFFVAVGMLIDPALVVQHAGAVLVFTCIVILGNVGAVTLTTFLTGSGTRTAVQTGMSLAQIGEFSFIIAGLGLSSGATSAFIYPIVVAVSALTTLSTPWLVRSADRVAAEIDGFLPRPIQTFVALYGAWIESLGNRPESSAERARLHRALRVLLIDAFVIVVLCVGAALAAEPIGRWLVDRTDLSSFQARGIVVSVAVALSMPFFIGILWTGRALGQALARRAFPDPEPNRRDLAAAPRRAMIVSIQLATLLVVGTPVAATLQPFIPAPVALSLLAIVLIAVGIVIWRTATDLHGHVRAAAEAIVASIASQSHHEELGAEERALERAYRLLPGLGEPIPVRIEEFHPAAGRKLSELDLRGRTGATIIAISRGEDVVLVPDGHEVLQAGDVVALAGARPSVDAARRLLGVSPGGES